MRGIRLLAVLATLFLVPANNLFSQSRSVTIADNLSADTYPPFGFLQYSVSESIYTSTEIGGTTTFGSNPINRIEFSPYALSSSPSYGNVTIYMKNIPAATTTLADGNYSTTGYTQVYNGTVAFTQEAVFAGVTLSTPFNYVGTGNLQIMVVRSDIQTHPPGAFYTANGNNIDPEAFTTRDYTGNTAISTSTQLAASAFRPSIRLSYIAPGAPPLCVPSSIPASDEGNVPINQPLSWETAVGATSYDVYFGSNSPAPLAGNQAAATYTAPALLAPNTTYFYNIIAKNASGVATGCDELSFTTGTGISYCLPNSYWDCFYNDAITSFKLGTINNTTSCVATNLGYENFTNLITNLTQGEAYPLTITQGDAGDYVKVWIDFNDNGSFDDAGELVFGTTGNTGNVSGTINIAANAATGIHRMRVRNSYAINNFTSCASQWFGETEDYSVNILAPATPDADLTDITVSGCQGAGQVKITLKNSGNSPIAAGAASVKLYVKGANPQGPLTQTNPAVLAAGASVVLTFNATFSNIGENIDSAFVTKIAGDPNAFNDSILTGHFTAPVVAAPLAEDFEGDLDGWSLTALSLVNYPGDDFGAWYQYDTVFYPLYGPGGTEEYILPKSGQTALIFDSYTLEAGNTIRLTTPCITIPANANTGCGYVAGVYFAQDPQFTNADSMVVQISVNGLYTRLGVMQRYDSTLSTPFEEVPNAPPGWKLYTFDIGAYAGQTVQFNFDAYSEYGNQMAIDSFFIGPKTTAKNVALAGGNEADTTLTRAIVACDDKGWTYYHTANSADYLFGIQWDPSNTGANVAAKAAATAKLGVTPIWFASEDPANLKAAYALQRYWNVNLNGAALTAPVNVRFFYAKGELDSMNQAKANFVANNPGTSERPTNWFIKTTGAFNPYTDLTGDGVANSASIADANTIAATINNVLYAQFNGITNLTGGSATTSAGSATAITYTFTGNGNWSIASNWSNNTVPPTTLPAGSTIAINHAVGGQCVLNVSQTISAGATFTVFQGKNLIIPGVLNVQ